MALIASLLVSVPVLMTKPQEAPVRRVALTVGAHDGGPERARLRWAASDANALSRVLAEVGGLEGEDRLRIEDPTAAELREAFAAMRRRVRTVKGHGQQVQFVFYYSGHSDEAGLLLGKERVDYKTLRRWVEGVGADVRIGVLDSCASGAFTRLKGGRRRAPFLLGSPSKARGHAYLTSSSADETAQESDRLGGSFFTHYLVAGLRGAADANHDRRVTLSEAYRFAFDETLQRTETTQGGPQHAAYEINLAGSGDLVMTDLRETDARLGIASDVVGRLYIRDAEGNLVAEVRKLEGSGPMILAVEPGKYRLVLDRDGSLYSGSLDVAKGGEAVLSVDALTAVEPEATRRRGDVPADSVPAPLADPWAKRDTPKPVAHDAAEAKPPVEEAPNPAPKPAPSTTIPASMAFVTPLTMNDAHGGRVRNYAMIGFIGGSVDVLDGVALSLGFNLVKESMHGLSSTVGANISRGPVFGVQAAVGANVSSGPVRGLQAAVGANVVVLPESEEPGEVYGLQAAVGGNVVGAKGSAVKYKGAQVAVGGHVVTGSSRGAQVAVGANTVTGGAVGAQLAVAANVVRGPMRGAQFGVGASVVTEEMRGVQMGVGPNVASTVHGAQVGLINVARQVDGAQIGLLNFARDAKAQVGLVSATRKGGVWADVWTSDLATFNVGMRLRSKHTYSYLGLGLHPLGTTHKGLTYGLGFGGRLPLGKSTSLEFDLGAWKFHKDYRFKPYDSAFISRARAMFMWRTAKRSALWVGPTFSVSHAFRDGEGNDPLVAGYEFSVHNKRTDGYQQAMWPGVVLGLQI